MARKLFGTDGIRGKANQEPMTAETALRVAMAAGHRFTRGDHRHLVVIGKDTRLSNYMIEPAMQAGFTAMGMDVVLVGPMPTPAVAMLTLSLRADLGVMISASHNPYEDNGIKLFGPDSFKLSDDVEEEIETLMENGLLDHLAPSNSLGRARRLEDAPGRYIEFVKHSFPRGLRLDGLKVVVDCANGAAYKVAPRVFHELGADVLPMAIEPDGTNINRDCGATATAALQEQVVAHGADLGVALDGDADRVILCDENGAVVDGDQVMAMIARSWQSAGRVTGGGIVATVMSNLGLEKYLESIELNLERSAVGDRYVLERMRAGGFNLGGEQSGHLILSEYSTTGDGLIAALQVLAAKVETDAPMSAFSKVFEPYPQVLKNVRVTERSVMEAPAVQSAVSSGEKKLDGEGRILIRPSGTEPLIRVMAEGLDEDLVTAVVDDIVDAISAVAV
ncbi:MAG: phosphoglucosamine mutase [Alphaproteobacteria bacterium]|nr:phosphoglucosamine mutase [Alphaproteobacteria bacterium]